MTEYLLPLQSFNSNMKEPCRNKLTLNCPGQEIEGLFRVMRIQSVYFQQIFHLSNYFDHILFKIINKKIMKKIIRLFYLLLLILPALSISAQKYKKIEDTAKLTKEYVNVSNDIVELTAKLTVAQNDLPGYQSKARDADNDAASAASASSDQASKATNGNVKDAKSAKRKANKAYDEAKDSRSAKSKVSDQEDKITRYQLEIKKKQQRLEDLDLMRAAINAKMTTDSIPKIQN
jgi:hypothetical protein